MLPRLYSGFRHWTARLSPRPCWRSEHKCFWEGSIPRTNEAPIVRGSFVITITISIPIYIVNREDFSGEYARERERERETEGDLWYTFTSENHSSFMCPSWLSPSASWLQEERRQEVGIWRRGEAEQISRPTTTPLRAQPKPCAFYLELSAGTYASEAALEYTPQCAVQCKTRSRTVKTTSCLPTLGKTPVLLEQAQDIGWLTPSILDTKNGDTNINITPIYK
jgi:hypothetical protein